MNAQSEPTQLRRDGDVVRVEGPLTLQTVTAALHQSRSVFPESGSPLVIDLSGVEESDSAALALLLEWLRQGRRGKREVRYRNLPQRLLQLARISDLEKIINTGE